MLDALFYVMPKKAEHCCSQASITQSLNQSINQSINQSSFGKSRFDARPDSEVFAKKGHNCRAQAGRRCVVSFPFGIDWHAPLRSSACQVEEAAEETLHIPRCARQAEVRKPVQKHVKASDPVQGAPCAEHLRIPLPWPGGLQ